MNRWFFLFSILLLGPIPALAAPPTHDLPVINEHGETLFTVEVLHDSAGLNLHVADLGNDGVSEFLVGGGIGEEPRVHVLRSDGSEIGSFLAYASTLGVGINITTCDLTGDGYNEIITAPQRGGGPHIRIFNRYGEAIDNGGFFAYAEQFRGGVNLTCGELTGDTQHELVTLPAAGGGAHVRVWSFENEEALVTEFFAHDITNTDGLVGTIAQQKLFLAQQHTQTPIIQTWVIHTQPTLENEQSVTTNAQGIHDIIHHNNELFVATDNTATLMNVTQGTQQVLNTTHGSLHITSDGEHLYHTSGRKLFHEQQDEKRIVVDISEQRLYAWEQGRLRNVFYISSGLNGATPLGNHEVLAKVPEVHYAWTYGPDHPENYDLGWIPYNLRFYPHIYIHYAPWHDNFGYQMSHGCVNVNLENVQWVYAWAEEGIPLDVIE
jgi:lipoprotein-anchoring transpeptidase ErfK/SrfK